MDFEWQQDQANLITFVMVDAAGTEVSGLGATFTLQMYKNTSGPAASAGTKGELGNGWYYYLNDPTEADTPGVISIFVTGAGAVQQNIVCVVRQRTVNAIEFTYTLTDFDTGNPVEGAEIWFATDSNHTHVVWYGVTDAFGVPRDSNGRLPLLDTGTYYLLIQRAGYENQTDTEVVSA